MPTVTGQPIAEDVVALLQQHPSAFALAGHMDVITGGLVDLVNRVRNLEHGQLVNAQQARRLTSYLGRVHVQ